MSRNGISLTLALALAWVALAQGQASNPASTSPESRVGKVITVTEANRAPEKCMVLQVWRLADGSPAMQTKSITTGELMSIVETPRASGARFRVFRWGVAGVPPQGCPVPPGTKLPAVAEGPKVVVASSVRPAVGKVSADPKREGVVQAPYLPPADARHGVVHAAARPEPQPLPKVPTDGVKETRTNTGPVIVGQPNVPVVLASQANPAAPAPAADKPASGAPAAPAAPTTPAPGPIAGNAPCCEEGKLIWVTEPKCAPQQCRVLSVCCQPDGSKSMQVKNLCTGECFTIVERCRVGSLLERFCLFRGHRQQPCPVVCAACEGVAPPAERIHAPREASPMPKPTAPGGPSAGMTGSPSKYGSLLPPGEAPVLSERPSEKQVIAASQPERVKMQAKPVPSLVETTMAATPAKPAKESTWKRFWSRSEAKSSASKPEALPKPELVKETKAVTAKPAEPKAMSRPAEKKAEAKPVATVKKTELVSGPTMVKPMPAVEPAAKQPDLPVPVPLIPLATTEPRPMAPPPQPPINPYSTMQSVSMAKFAPQEPLPAMCPTCHRALPGAITAAGVQQASACPSCPPAMPVASGPSSPSLWTRGPAMPVSQSPVMVPARRLMSETEAQAMQNTVHLMTVLQSSGVPAQREWAAARLRVCDPQMQPYVVESLVTAAKTDGAALVRAAAIQSLAQMKANTPPVLVALEDAKQDRDPRVRDEAILAVRLLTGHDSTTVQPAVHKVEKQ